ncbi:MAG TPA: hypothetical protein VL495_05475 [Edaphobacter sp.]|jgi:hypothetical protein|nr:hypothetical protein [Edaphobacter sp.]
MSDPIDPTRNDPTPQRRKGDSRFLPVVIIAAIALILILIASVALIGGKGKRLIPHGQDNHPESTLIAPLQLAC